MARLVLKDKSVIECSNEIAYKIMEKQKLKDSFIFEVDKANFINPMDVARFKLDVEDEVRKDTAEEDWINWYNIFSRLSVEDRLKREMVTKAVCELSGFAVEGKVYLACKEALRVWWTENPLYICPPKTIWEEAIKTLEKQFNNKSEFILQIQNGINIREKTHKTKNHG